VYTLDDLELLLGDDPGGRRYLNKLQFGQVRFLPTSEPSVTAERPQPGS
jgi:hypothetical protein